MYCYKQSRRRDNSFAVVNAGFRVVFERPDINSNWVIKDCILAYGGMGPKILTAKQTSSVLIGRYETIIRNHF